MVFLVTLTPRHRKYKPSAGVLSNQLLCRRENKYFIYSSAFRRSNASDCPQNLDVDKGCKYSPPTKFPMKQH